MPIINEISINKNVEFVLVKKLPVVLIGKISAINTIKKGTNNFFISLFFLKKIVFKDSRIITKNIVIIKNIPTKPHSVAMCK